MYRYPSANQSRSRPPARQPGGLFLLGDHPDAMHVLWTAPDGARSTLPVDGEPVPFWDGTDEADRIDRWKRVAGFMPEWGVVEPAGAVNGAWGRWIGDNVLAPLGVSQDETWTSHCLDTFRATNAQIAAISDRFVPFAESKGLEPPSLPRHISEAAIVREALADHFVRLTGELREAQPTTIVTLGNAALRVMRELVDGADALEPRLYAEPYGRRLLISFEGRSIAWYPLVHPRTRGSVKHAHVAWILLRSDPVTVARRGLCPACRGKGLVPIRYGMPADNPWDDVRRGRVVIGGCVITGEDPEQQCVECGASVYDDGSFEISEW